MSKEQMSIWSLQTIKIRPEETSSQNISESKANEDEKDTKLSTVIAKFWNQLKFLVTHPLAIPVLQGLGLGIISTIWILILVIVLWKNTNKQTNTNNLTTATTSTSACLFSLTPFQAPTLASWPLDGSLSDLNNIYHASYTNPLTISYTTGNIGQAVSFGGTQYVYSNTKFLDLSYRSWTIEAWLLIKDLSSDRDIFGQCESMNSTNRCLRIGIRNNRLYMSFTNSDLIGTTYLSTSATIWHHVAFVYDYQTMEQSIYLDGFLETTTKGSGVLVGPYKGRSGILTIGWTTGNQFFLGDIDQVQVFGEAKTACQILNDATLTAYYSFDDTMLHLDANINYFHGDSKSLLRTTGRVNQAYSFQYFLSYFQSRAFTAYQPGEAFSVALWIKPYFVDGGTLIHISTDLTGSSTSCFDLLGFSRSGQLIGQLFSGYAACCVMPTGITLCPCQSTTNVGGPIISLDTWTHVALTYNSDVGLALYTNGVLRDLSDPFASFPTAAPDYKVPPNLIIGSPTTTGSNPTCLIGFPALFPDVYHGSIDELRIYSRALTITEINTLFNQ